MNIIIKITRSDLKDKKYSNRKITNVVNKPFNNDDKILICDIIKKAID